MTDSDIRHYITLQPIMNIGMIGHVSNGKSTLVKAITGIATQKHADERIRNITIRMGYANAKIWRCYTCPKPQCYQATTSDIFDFRCRICSGESELINHVSFCDAPGHNLLMATMLNGTAVMDSTILVESVVNDIIPAPQTQEHLVATRYIGIDTSFVCMNKLDLADRKRAEKNISSLVSYLAKLEIDAPIIPVSGTFGSNIDVLCEYLASMRPPVRNLDEKVKMLVIRSFNVNMPGTMIENLKGGVIGGSVIKGRISVGDRLMAYPGYIIKASDRKQWSYRPIEVTVISICSEKNALKEAIPGGLIGVQLDIDPALTAEDRMVGQVITSLDIERKVYSTIIADYTKIDDLNVKKKSLKVNDTIVINVNANNTEAIISDIDENTIELQLNMPTCIDESDNIIISIKDHNSMTIIASAKLKFGVETLRLE